MLWGGFIQNSELDTAFLHDQVLSKNCLMTISFFWLYCNLYRFRVGIQSLVKFRGTSYWYFLESYWYNLGGDHHL